MKWKICWIRLTGAILNKVSWLIGEKESTDFTSVLSFCFMP